MKWKLQPIVLDGLLVLLLASAVMLQAKLIVRLDFDGENSRTETESLYALRAACTGQQLYHDYTRPPHILTQYTPLFYFAPAGIAHALRAPSTLVGRGYTYAFWLGVAGLLYSLVRQEGGTRLGGALAMLLWLSTGLAPQWANSYRPDAPALFFSLAAIWAYRRQRLSVAVGFLVVAVLHKQSAIVPLTVIVLEECQQRKFARAGAIVAVWSAVFMTALWATQIWSGGAFLKNAFGSLARYNFATAPLYTALALTRGAPAFAGAIFSRDSRLWKRYFWTALVLAIIGVMKAGANVNYFLEPFAAACVLTGLWVGNAKGMRSVVWTGLTVASAVLTLTQGVRRPSTEQWDEILPQFRSLPEPLLIEDSYLAYRLNRTPYILNVANFGAMRGRGGFDERELLQRLNAGEFGAVIAIDLIERNDHERPLPARWREAILQHYKLKTMVAPNVLLYQRVDSTP